MNNSNLSLANQSDGDKLRRMNVLVTPTLPTALRAAAAPWAEAGVKARLRIIRRARHLIAAKAESLAATVNRPRADTLTAEILPLLEAARFLEREAPALLSPRRLRRGRPLWLFGVKAGLHREPLGAILILAPGNYPIFLPGAQILQALVAGNAVALKPAPAGAAAAHALAALLAEAGLPPGLLHVLGPDDGPSAVRSGYDHILLTGAAETGAKVLEAAAATLTPCTMELSGADPVFVLPGADLRRVAECLAYGLRLNGGATCIAPRRVLVHEPDAKALEALLLPLLARIPDAETPAPIAERLEGLLEHAVTEGARLHHKGRNRPAVLLDTPADVPLLRQDVFAPWLALIPVETPEQALRLAAANPYALGASIFGPIPQAQVLASSVNAGSVCINDLIVPTADPRLPFGGRAKSGFGVTRGPEGLLAMTRLKTISTRVSGPYPHLRPPAPDDARQFGALIRLLHGGWKGRAQALRMLSRR